jgi:hypothetical protein
MRQAFFQKISTRYQKVSVWPGLVPGKKRWREPRPILDNWIHIADWNDFPWP